MSRNTQEIVMDRAFDAACLKVKGEEEWSNQILTRLKATHPENKEYIENLFNFYVNMVSSNTTFLVRADYMIEHKNNLKLKYR